MQIQQEILYLHGFIHIYILHIFIVFYDDKNYLSLYKNK